MAIVFNPFTGTFDFTGTSGGGGSSNSFEIIQCDAGTSPTASSATDTLTLTSTDITITGSAGAKSVTFALKTVTVAHGGTGQVSALTQYGIIFAASTTAMACTAAGTSGYLLTSNNSSAPTYQQLNLASSAALLGILPAANGGTGNGFTAVSGPTTSTKTFTLPDASDTIACLAQANAFTKAQYVTPVALTPGSTVSWDVRAAMNATLTPVQSFTLSNPTNLAAGMSGMLTVTQDGTGSRVITWSSAYKFVGGTKFVLSTAASARDEIAWYSPDGTVVEMVGNAAFS